MTSISADLHDGPFKDAVCAYMAVRICCQCNIRSSTPTFGHRNICKRTTLTGGVISSAIDWFLGCASCKICVQIVRDVFPQVVMRALTHH